MSDRKKFEARRLPSTEWVGHTPNETPRPVVVPLRIAIHSMAGYWAGSIEWNKNPNVRASAHFYIRSSDGHIGQLVSEREQAWGSFFRSHPSTGEIVPESYRGYHFFHIDHEDLQHTYTDDDWITNALLDSSARLVAYLCTTYSIPINRERIMGHNEIPVADHRDPGPFWPWKRYMNLVRRYANIKPPFELKKYNLVHKTPGARSYSPPQEGPRLSIYALPIRMPEAKTSAPPRTTCSADMRKLMSK